MAKIKWSKTTINAIGTIPQGLVSEIEAAYKLNGELKSFIRKIFQRANRRIQNIEQSGLYSPAVQVLHLSDDLGFTKFRLTGNLFEDKTNFAKAVAFLRSPTSTASGSREYSKALAIRVGIKSQDGAALSKWLQQHISEAASEFVEQQQQTYADTKEYAEQAFEDEAEQIERASMDIENQVDKKISDRYNDIMEDITPAFTGIDV